MESAPQAVVFDLDGLLFNTEELYEEVGTEVLRRRGRDFTPELIHAMMGRPGHVALSIMIEWHGLDDTVEALVRESEQVFDAILRHRLAPMPGADALLQTLESRGIPRAIATSSTRRFVQTVLGMVGWHHRFNFFLTCEDVVHGKPHPEVYELAASRLGLAPSQVLVLEDSQNGCRAAVAARTVAVAVPSGHSLAHDFSGAALVAESLADERIYRLLGLAK